MNEKQKRQLITLIMVVALVVLFGATTTSFFTAGNISNLFRGASYLGIVAVGLTIVIIAGGNNLSTGATVGFVAMLVSRMVDADMPVILCIIIGIAAGAACGAVDGLLITKLHLPDFVATLATNYVYSGMILAITFRQNNRMVTKALSDQSFLRLGTGVGDIFYVTIAWLALVIIVQFILNRTKFGIHVYAVGTNASASRISGINVDRVKILAYTISGLMCGIAAIFLLAYEGAASAKTGEVYTFNAICATIIGGAALTGGRGDALGTFLGCIFMQLITNGIYKMNLASEYQTLLVGAAILIMSVFNTVYIRYATRKARLQNTEAQKGGTA